MLPRAAFEKSTLLGFNTRKQVVVSSNNVFRAYYRMELKSHEEKAAEDQVTAIAVVSAGERMFVGTADGTLSVHECRADTTNALKAGSFECREVDTLNKGLSSDRRPVLDLLAVEGWRALLGIIDGQLTAYDMYTYRPLANAPVTRGASCFCVDETRRMVFVANKKRVQVLAWHAVSLPHRRDFSLPDTPRSMALVPGSADARGASPGPKLVLSFKKEYSVLDTAKESLAPVLLLNDREQLDSSGSSSSSVSLGIILPVPASSARGARVLLSSGSRGLLVDLVGRAHEERLTWSAPPQAVRLSTAFFVAAVAQQVEVHDLATLAPLQTFDSLGTTCMATCPVGGGRGDLTFVATANSIHLLKLIPIEVQVEQLAEKGHYGDALSLCAMCKDVSVLGSVNVMSIHERYAYDLFSWGDPEGAVGHFLIAETSIEHVLSLFPSLVPPEFDPAGMLQGSSRRGGLSFEGLRPAAEASRRPISTSRAASAVTRFLEKYRPDVLAALEREGKQDPGAQLEDGLETRNDRASSSLSSGKAGTGSYGRGFEEGTSVADSGDSGTMRAADRIILLDTMLVSAYMQCSPPRHSALIELLSGTNYCSLEACAPLLAASGPAFVEALLCLYRGRGLHQEALALATEQRCIAHSQSSSSGGGGSGWTAPQFRRWLADYLRELRLSSDPVHRTLVLRSARPIFEADPTLGLSIFVDQRQGSHHSLQRRFPGGTRRGSATGKGGGEGEGEGDGVGAGMGLVTGMALGAKAGQEGRLAPQDIVSFLKSITPTEAGRAKAEADAVASAPAASTSGRLLSSAKDTSSATPAIIPLSSGRGLAIRYLQVLIDSSARTVAGGALSGGGMGDGGDASARDGAAAVSSALHDELAYLLMEGLLVEQGAAADRGQLATRKQTGADKAEATSRLALAYRQRLQLFLQTSESYNPARLLSVVPSHFLEEHALLLSRLGRHQEVLNIYVTQLKNRAMAEAYCSRIWEKAESAAKARSRSSTKAGAGEEPVMDDDVYLCLLRVYLGKEGEGNLGPSKGAYKSRATANPEATRDASQGVRTAEAEASLDDAISLLERHFDRVDPVKVMSLLPPDVPVKKLLTFLGSAVRHAEARRRNNQVTHHLCRADYVNVKFELIQLKGQVSRVPELSLASFHGLDKLLRTCPPVDLTDPTADYGVTCIKHIFEAYVVLQFEVSNGLSDHRLHNVLVKVECSDPDLYSVKTERPLSILPPHGSGSCYTVLVRSYPASVISGKGSGGGSGPVGAGVGASSTLFMCELRFTSTRATSTGSGQGLGLGINEVGYEGTGGFLEEYVLEDLELSVADLGE